MIKEYDGHKPKVDKTAFIAEQALVIGKVSIGAHVSLWPGVVARGDVEDIIIGEDTNLQEGVLVHTNYGCPAIIGKGVTIGHGAIIHGCRIGDNCLIGMGAVVLDGAVIGDNCLIGAGSVVTEKDVIAPGSLVLGTPGRVKRELKEEEIKKIARSAQEYKEFARIHKKSGSC